MPGKILDHSSHWKSWYQYGEDVACSRCNVVLYTGELPTNTKTILEILDRDFLNYPIKGQEIMPTRNPPFAPKVVSDEEMDNYKYEDNDNQHRYEDEEPTPEAVANHPSGSNLPKNEVAKPLPESAPGSQVALKSTFSRTIKDNNRGEFGSITASFELLEVYPGEMSPEEIQQVAELQFQLLKSETLKQLGLPFTQDEATGMIMETFPGSTVVSSGQPATAAEPPREAAQARQAPARSNPAPRRQQANTGQRGRSGGNPQPDVMWQELMDYPGDWYWNAEKSNPQQPDFYSTKYFSAEGWPVGLWMESRFPGASCPDPEYVNSIEESAFAQRRPARRN